MPQSGRLHDLGDALCMNAPTAKIKRGITHVSYAGNMLPHTTTKRLQDHFEAGGTFSRNTASGLVDSRRAFCHEPTARPRMPEDTSTVHIYASSTCRKYSTQWIRSCCWKFFLTSVRHRRWRQLSANSTTECGLPCKRTMANNRIARGQARCAARMRAVTVAFQRLILGSATHRPSACK